MKIKAIVIILFCDEIDLLLQNASLMLRDDSNLEHDMSNTNEESIIIVPGSNYTERINESMYSDESQSYRGYCEVRKHWSN